MFVYVNNCLFLFIMILFMIVVYDIRDKFYGRVVLGFGKIG